MFRRIMLTNDGKDLPLYKEILPFVNALGLDLVEVRKNETKGGVVMCIIVSRKDGSVTTGDLEGVYNVLYPRYQVKYTRSLEMEVSSPGIERTIKDVLEFPLFVGKSVKVYVPSLSSYVTGVIRSASPSDVILGDYRIIDKDEGGDEMLIPYDDIAKAKLDGGL